MNAILIRFRSIFIHAMLFDVYNWMCMIKEIKKVVQVQKS